MTLRFARWQTGRPTGAATSTAPALAAVSSNPALLRLAHSPRVLMLQGPVGPFFDRLAGWLALQGVEVHRVVFQPGDRRDCQALDPIEYTGSRADWPDQLDRLIATLRIDTLVLFGQVRPLHVSAMARARELGLSVVVLEEGYVRPGYVTMELGGVNAMSTTLQRYQWVPVSPGPQVSTQRAPHVPHEFWQMAWFACRHYWALNRNRPIAPDYRHHRQTDLLHHSLHWFKSWAQKHVKSLPDHLRIKALQGSPYYFIPLQQDGDSQITHHSRFESVIDFLGEVMASFARHAPADSHLVIRQHPHARGERGQAQFLRELSRQLGVQGRVSYLIEGHTPTLVSCARGVVVINSTVGLQALMHNKPLAVLGDAMYRQPGLCFAGSLDEFWSAAPAPLPEHTRHFLEQLIALTQVPCNVYGKADEPLHWRVQPQAIA